MVNTMPMQPRQASTAKFGRRTLLALLIGLNAILGALLLLEMTSLPAARAQGGNLRGDFACVTAKPLGQSYDVFYMLDVRERKLHALYPSRGRQMKYVQAPPRDVAADFGR